MDQVKQFDAVVIGAGLSGLTAASLLGKRGLRVAVVEHHRSPGGSCGAFKRGDALFDQGSAMLFGFGEEGFNAHRFVFNCLEEPFTVLKHELLYCVNFRGHRIRFYPDIELFSQELGRVFPNERDNIRRFYRDMEVMYRHVMVDNPAYTTPDETDKRNSLKGMLKGLYLCGESTVMGTGTPTVTTSGISAANAVLAKEGLAPFRYQKDMPNFVTTAQSPMTKDKLYSAFPLEQREVMTLAMACRFCEHPSCSKTLDVPGMMRRAAVGNIRGAAMLLKKYAKTGPLDRDFLDSAQRRCVRCAQGLPPAPIAEVCRYLETLEDKDPVSV